MSSNLDQVQQELEQEASKKKGLFDILLANDERRKSAGLKEKYQKQFNIDNLSKSFEILAILRRGVDYIHHVRIKTGMGEVEIPFRMLSIKEKILITDAVNAEFKKHPEYISADINPLYNYLVMAKTLARATSSFPDAPVDTWTFTEDEIFNLNEESFNLLWREYLNLQQQVDFELTPDISDDLTLIIDQLVSGVAFQTKKSKLTFIRTLTYSQLCQIVMNLSESIIALGDSIRFGMEQNTTSED